MRRLTDGFIDGVLAVEAAWTLLDEGRVDEAVTLAPASVAVLLRAATLIAGDAAHALVERAGALEGPSAPAFVALARSRWARGDLSGARVAFEGAMRRARPDAPLALELAAVASDSGDAARVASLVAMAARLPCRDGGAAVAVGHRLADHGHARLAAIAFERGFRRGVRDAGFLVRFAGLLGDLPSADAELVREVPVLAAQARLATGVDVAALARAASAREASPVWVRVDRLGDHLAERIARAEPFSWIRLGDGEARFLMWVDRGLRGGLDDDAARAVIDWIWRNWFGTAIDAVDPARLTALAERFASAVAGADLLGVPTAMRLAHDPLHVGYLAMLERHVAGLAGERRFCDASANYALNEADPLLARLLSGLPFLGVIGPHEGLAARLAARHGIARTAAWDIPGEGRLGREREAADRGRHFPDAYDRVMATLAVPFPGAVFLVAGGLLGKVYAARIRDLGGIALDIGAVADAWVGVNTRGPVLDRSMGAPL